MSQEKREQTCNGGINLRKVNQKKCALHKKEERTSIRRKHMIEIEKGGGGKRKRTTPFGMFIVENDEKEMPMAPSPTHSLVTLVCGCKTQNTQFS